MSHDLTCMLSALWIALGIGALLWVSAGDADAEEIIWTDARQLTLEGQGHADMAAPYDRLPAKAQGVVREPVWDLSRDSAGLCVRFVTDAPVIHVRWDLLKPTLAMEHMPATGVSGVDLYAKQADGTWRYLGTGRPTGQAGNEAAFAAPTAAEFALYLPLYNGVTSVSIGVPASRSLTPAAPRGKPIVFYGTSITQGGCASRPGMAYPAIIGRALNVPIINLGFSGNGQSEPEMADLLAELDPLVYVLDPLWNMSPGSVEERIPPAVRKLRAAHPDTPIMLVEDCTIHNNIPTEKGRVLRDAMAQLEQGGLPGLHFLSAEGMMGPDDEATVDGCHPTDMGFMYQAQVFVRALRPLVAQ